MSDFYSSDSISALDAISAAQKIASGPMLFQAVYVLLKHGALKALEEAKKTGLTVEELSEKCSLSPYGTGVLLDMAVSGRVVYIKDNRYLLGKVGHFLLNDRMTRINMEFTATVCYQAMAALDESVVTGKPCGLKVFNENWETIYPHLSELPEDAKKSWFSWDHFYSDAAFEEALSIVLKRSPKVINDVGGNTGKFAVACCRHSESVKVNLVDLKEQIALARSNIEKEKLQDRVSFTPCDVLKGDLEKISTGDLWWMSQFLDCFSESQIVAILSSIRKVMRPDAEIAILEPLWDKQKFEAASFSLNAGSLYFTALANGCSRFYSAAKLHSLIAKAGLKVVEEHHNLGVCQSLIICRQDS